MVFGTFLATYRPSLRRWARASAVVWLVCAAVVTMVSIGLLHQIADDAQATYKHEIPDLLSRNRDAIKIERLASFLRTIVATRDAVVERRFVLQLQTLAQGFDIDNDARLVEGSRRAIASARRIVGLHGTLRRLGQDGAAQAQDVERQAQQAGDEALQALDALTDYVTNDAALRADGMANRIQRNVWGVERGWFAALGLFVGFGLILFWIGHRHVLSPIAMAVRGLRAISEADDAAVELPRTRFFELDMITRAIEQYARFAGDLRTANVALRRLSEQDGLTGIPNRRSFDVALTENCRRAAARSGDFALLLIDIDHFKALNDRLGHLVGDQCLRQVATTLCGTSSRYGGQVFRYGGEEFAVILPSLPPYEARDRAERLRTGVERMTFQADGHRRATDVTVSLGMITVAAGDVLKPDEVIRAADEALYRAKRNGRNRVCVSPPDPPGLMAASVA